MAHRSGTPSFRHSRTTEHARFSWYWTLEASDDLGTEYHDWNGGAFGPSADGETTEGHRDVGGDIPVAGILASPAALRRPTTGCLRRRGRARSVSTYTKRGRPKARASDSISCTEVHSLKDVRGLEDGEPWTLLQPPVAHECVSRAMPKANPRALATDRAGAGGRRAEQLRRARPVPHAALPRRCSSADGRSRTVLTAKR